MSLDKAHTEQMNKLDELIETAKERKLTKFVELILASIVGVVASKLFDAIYSTPITNVADSFTRAFLFTVLLLGITAFLFISMYWTDIIRDIRKRRKKTG
jgi:DMSO reductase anchor subunit